MRFRRMAGLLAPLAGMALAAAAPASAKTFVVVLKEGNEEAGVAAIERAGGTVVGRSNVGVVTVTSDDAGFAGALEASGGVDGVAGNAGWRVRTRFADASAQ